MPNRVVCGAILLFWTIAAGSLFTRDFLPSLLPGGPPPDLRTIAMADEPEGPVRWSILAANEGPKENLRSVGQITTQTKRQSDGWVRMTSDAWLDMGEMMKKTPAEPNVPNRKGVVGSCEIDPTGNLSHFRVGIREGDGPRAVEMFSLEGRHRKDMLDVSSHGLLGDKHWSLAYRPREIVQNSLGPLDRMPGLQLGQKWESQVISPLSMLGFGMGEQIQTCRVEVVAVEHTVWNNDTISVLKVVASMGPLSVATWVRHDGLVIRQELPFPTRGGKLILDRIPADDPATNKPATESHR